MWDVAYDDDGDDGIDDIAHLPLVHGPRPGVVVGWVGQLLQQLHLLASQCVSQAA